MTASRPSLPWLEAGDPFPPPDRAWAQDSPAPGLLAAGGSLNAQSLQAAYRQGIFPWFSDDQPLLWWSTDPRMVLHVQEFRLHRSLRKKISSLRAAGRLEIRVDTAFEQVIARCASLPRPGQGGTWIVTEMVDAYCALHTAGLAHSIETWLDGELVAGLYCVALGRAVFGESMYTHVTDGSKMALAALVALCRVNDVPQIDCQQVTAHLASLGGRPVPRAEFLRALQIQVDRPPLTWAFQPVYWNQLFQHTTP